MYPYFSQQSEYTLDQIWIKKRIFFVAVSDIEIFDQ